MTYVLIEVSNLHDPHVVATGCYEHLVSLIPSEVMVEADADHADCFDAFNSAGQIYVIEHLGSPLSRRLLD